MKDKQFTILNIFGLSAGLVCTLLIFLWVSDERSIDKFFANDERLFRLLEHRGNAGQTFFTQESSGRLSETVKETFPEVEYASAVAPAHWFPQNTLSVDEKNIKANGQYGEKDYFNIFSFQLLEGDKNKLLSDKSSIVISDELSHKLFGTTENVIGKQVEFDHNVSFNVSGIFKKVPDNSSQQFDFMLSLDYLRTVKDWITQWNSSGPSNFVLLKAGTDIDAFNRKVRNIITANTGDTTRRVIATKFSDGYLYNHFGNTNQAGERIEYVNLFMALAIFILIIACINFMNLSTAKASRRLKEVGVKKVVGAKRSHLVVQFLMESFLLTVAAMLIAAIVIVVVLPGFNQLTGKNMVLQFSLGMVSTVISIVLITSFLAGSYPALYISGFKPLAVLKGKLRNSTAELLSRKGLVVFQFTLSTILIVSVAIIYQQVQFIRNTKLGYNKDNIIRIRAEGNLQTRQEAFLNEMQKLPGVVNTAYTYHNIVGRTYSDSRLEWAGKDPNRGLSFEIFGVSYNFPETMDIKIKAGRSFSKEFGTDSLSIIINESAAKAMGLSEPVGTVVYFHGRELKIVGVMKDFHFESMHEPIKPSIMHLQNGEGTLVVRINQNNQQQTLAEIETLYKKYNPGFPFTYNYLDEAYQKQYASETLTVTLAGYFAGLAIIISCLGLFGLAAFMAQKRQKEIGIRKVIGASVIGITAMLSKEFLKLVVVAMLIAFPVSWWLMNDWLEGYAYRINLTGTVFFITALVVLVITIITIGYQTVKAAVTNPVKSLRTE